MIREDNFVLVNDLVNILSFPVVRKDSRTKALLQYYWQ